MGVTHIRVHLRHSALWLLLSVLAACEVVDSVEPVLTPRARPNQIAQADPPAAPSAESEALRLYYGRVLQDGRTRGLLRTDGGGPDTPYSADTLVRNFEDIAFYNEYDRGDQPLRRWEAPVRIEAHFGPTVDPADRTRDLNALIAYANRLSRITGHTISVGRGRPNFHVFFVSEDERDAAVSEIRRLEPTIDATTLQTIRNIPRSTYCLVVALTHNESPAAYTGAVALIRSEQPELMRLSCIHEEVAQGLGLANDSPYARPSIFNDDDEFALLTSHDEILLSMLYDPRLRTGMRIEEARPLLRILARERTGTEL
jgi:hypothetical protein